MVFTTFLDSYFGIWRLPKVVGLRRWEPAIPRPAPAGKNTKIVWTSCMEAPKIWRARSTCSVAPFALSQSRHGIQRRREGRRSRRTVASFVTESLMTSELETCTEAETLLCAHHRQGEILTSHFPRLSLRHWCCKWDVWSSKFKYLPTLDIA